MNEVLSHVNGPLDSLVGDEKSFDNLRNILLLQP